MPRKSTRASYALEGREVPEGHQRLPRVQEYIDSVCGATCETCGQPIEKLRFLFREGWQHTESRLIGCRGADGYPIDGHAYPADWRERVRASLGWEFHRQGECGGDCAGCCNDAEMNS